jgi:hypothetical protein
MRDWSVQLNARIPPALDKAVLLNTSISTRSNGLPFAVGIKASTETLERLNTLWTPSGASYLAILPAKFSTGVTQVRGVSILFVHFPIIRVCVWV